MVGQGFFREVHTMSDSADPTTGNEAAGEQDFGPVVEQMPPIRRILNWLSAPEYQSGSAAKPAPGGFFTEDNSSANGNRVRKHDALADVHDFRPSLRAPVPVLTVLDDGSQEYGEQHRLRNEIFAIGRVAGDVVLSNDASISGTHAEIRRTPWKGGYQWQLHDIQSVNGTFVRCVRALLHSNALLILGARRFRLRNPLKPTSFPSEAGETRFMDGAHIPETVWPVLAEASAKAGGLQFPLRSESLTIGRAGGGADIELDDPLLAVHHASIRRLRDGNWMITSENTRNGIWVSVSAVALSSNCFFRCGEQLFRFTLP